MGHDNHGCDALFNAMKIHGVSFREALQAIEMAGNDKKFQKELDDVYGIAYGTEVLDEWDTWQ